jgi:putative PIN family toxin of toxin-antitoxin system
MRAVVDTNVWISALLNPAGHPARIRSALEGDRFTLVASAPLFEELARVMVRPRLVRRYGFGLGYASRLLTLVHDKAGELAEITGDIRLCRDPRDDMVIETALVGRADVLVSRDDDLKHAPEVATLLAERGVRVLTVQQFLDRLEDERSEAAEACT